MDAKYTYKLNMRSLRASGAKKRNRLQSLEPEQTYILQRYEALLRAYLGKPTYRMLTDLLLKYRALHYAWDPHWRRANLRKPLVEYLQGRRKPSAPIVGSSRLERGFYDAFIPRMLRQPGEE